MSSSGWLQPYHRVIAGSIGLVVFVAIAWLVVSWAFGGDHIGDSTPQAYFYDLHRGELFTADANLDDPLPCDGGPFDGHPAGVRAQVFACGQCSDDSLRYIGWLEIPAVAIGMEQEGDETLLYIRRVEDKKWVSSESSTGRRIVREATSRCNGSRPNPCNPGHEQP